MADIALELDAAASNVDGSNPGTSLLLTDSAAGWGLISLDAPSPEQDPQWASSVDTEGELLSSTRDRNRIVTIVMEFTKTTDALVETEFNKVGQKIGKFRREGGTLKLTTQAGTVGIFDVAAGANGFPWDHALVLGKLGQVTLTLICAPYIRGTEIDLGDNVETTLPALIFTDTGVKGDVPGLGRLVIDEDQAKAQSDAYWGLESRYYSSASTAALYAEAESLTASGSGALAVGPAGASGGGSNVIKYTTAGGGAGSWVDALTTQASGGGAHRSHIGQFSVLARVYEPNTNIGTGTSVRLSWTQADLGVSVFNDGASLNGANRNFWQWVDLGQISIRKVTKGTQQWLGTVQVNTGATSDVLNIDSLLLIPLERSGHASGTLSNPAVRASQSLEVRHDSVSRSSSNGGWGKPPSYEGDYLLIPPAGLESRTVRIVVKMLHVVDVVGAVGDTIDDLSARLFYTPRYLAIPAA